MAEAPRQNTRLNGAVEGQTPPVRVRPSAPRDKSFRGLAGQHQRAQERKLFCIATGVLLRWIVGRAKRKSHEHPNSRVNSLSAERPNHLCSPYILFLGPPPLQKTREALFYPDRPGSVHSSIAPHDRPKHSDWSQPRYRHHRLEVSFHPRWLGRRSLPSFVQPFVISNQPTLIRLLLRSVAPRRWRAGTTRLQEGGKSASSSSTPRSKYRPL
jgi:hypothetical protein